MSSLVYCLEQATDLTDSEKNYVTAKVKAYKAVGDTPKDAILDIVTDLVLERADIVKQIQAKIKPKPEKPKKPGKGKKQDLGVSDKADTKKAKASDQLGTWVAEKLFSNTEISWRDLFNEADRAFGGSQSQGVYSVKDAYDAMEVGINRLIANKQPYLFNPSQPTVGKAQIAVRLLKQYVNLLPTQTKRTEEMDEFQQFSTPPPLAFTAAWAANLQPSDIVVEPSAGTGNIAIFAKNAGAKVTVNELSERRLDLLKLFDFDAYYNEDAGQINNILSDKFKPTVSVMNPPFTASAGRLKKGKRSVTIGQSHVSQAAALLQPGGRLVAIMGNNMAPEKGAFKIWARRITQQGMAIRANIGISGQEYKKYGTTWDNQLIILDKTPNTYDIITGKVDLIEDALPLIEGVRNDRADKGKRPSGKPESQEAPGQDEILSGPGTPLQPSTGGLGSTGGPLQTEKPGSDAIPGGTLDTGTPQQSSLFPPTEGGKQPGSGNAGSKRPTGGGLPSHGAAPLKSHGISPRLSETDPSSIAQELDIRAKEAEAKGEITDDLYEGYEPERMSLKGMQKHPTPLVQSAAMASVSPPKPTYKPKLPLKAIKSGKISDIQVEAIVYAGQAHSETLPDESRMGYFIGDGCVAGETRIYDPETDKHKTIHNLAEIGKPITVLSLTENGFATMKACAPFLKGEDDLYKIILKSGRTVTVTANHKFLTPFGWMRICDGLTAGHFLASAEGPPSYSLGFSPLTHNEDGLHWLRKPQDCLDRYCRELHPCDERFLSGQENGLKPSPSPVDVPGHNRDCPQKDVLDFLQECTHQRLLSFHHSKSDFSPSEIHDPSLILNQAVSISAQSLEAKPQKNLQSLSETIQPHPPAFSTFFHQQGHEGNLSRSANVFAPHDCVGNLSLSDESRCIVGQDPYPIGLMSMQSQYAKRLSPEQNFDAFSCNLYSRWDRIVSIEFLRHDVFYDMYVPGPENYVAEGIVHHNTGVGKGREIAGIIWDNWNRGRKKAVWVSEKDGLFKDARRDFNEAGWNSNKLFNHADIAATIKDKSGQRHSSHIRVDEGVLFTTYNKLGGRREANDFLSRFDQLVEWLGEDFDGVIAFDESHNLGNSQDNSAGRYTKPASLQGLAGVELQARLPKARIVYASATGATEVLNLAYAERLGLWGEGTAFTDKNDFIQKMASGGIAAMEQVARDMKALGVYTARSLSYDGVEQDTLLHKLSKKQIGSYNKYTEAWQVVLRNINVALQLTGATRPDDHDPNATVNVNGQAVSNAMSAFWGGHQRFFNQIITSMQTPSVIKSIKEDLKAGRSPVVQLTSTLEQATERAMARLRDDQTLDDLDLTPKDGLMQMVQTSFPVAQIETYVDDNGNQRSRVVRDSQGNIVINPEAVALREQLLDEVGAIPGMQGALDMLMDEFGPDMLAEVTGRKKRIIIKMTDKGEEKVVETWSRVKSANDAELYMKGKKKILVFSEAGGTGRSYHASLSHLNQDKRVHYLLQAGWRADKAIQGLGRTHRSNQKQPPKYFLVSTDLKGQKRFIATIARRLDQLGALTKGQRETGSSGIFNSRDNLETDNAETALRVLYSDLAAGAVPTISMDDFLQQTGLKLIDPRTGGLKASGLPPMKQFLNRLLSLNVETQNAFFDEFMMRMDRIIEAHVEAGTLDQGLETLKADKIEKVSEEVVRTDERTGAETKYVQLDVTRPTAIMRFADAEFYAEHFYRNKRSGKVWSQKRIVKTDRDGGNAEWYYFLKAEQYQSQSIKESQWNEENWDQLSVEAAKPLWDAQVEAAPKQRVDQYHLITGTLLPIWDRLIGHSRIFRIQTETGERMVGRLIPPAHLAQTLTNIGAEAAKIDLSPDQIFEKVLNDQQTITFANGIKLTRRMVSGDERIEITELEYNQFTPLEQKGAFSERIAWRTRFFVPTDQAAGARVIKRILSNNPVVLQEGGTTQRSFRLGKKETTPKRGPYNEKAMT
ncbi:MAG TPA: hypothetical protein DDW42_10250, partial [Desulfobacteraceae bacterium]|nr:hypothetical protein [Desulfobacteraceae bacterium]